MPQNALAWNKQKENDDSHSGIYPKTAHGPSFYLQGPYSVHYFSQILAVDCKTGVGFQHISIPSPHKTLLPGKFLAKEVPLLVVVIFIAVFVKGLYKNAFKKI